MTRHQVQARKQKTNPRQNARATRSRRKNGAGEASAHIKKATIAESKKIVTDITFNMPLELVFYYAHAPSF
ncbi:MAG: hypothetical protein H6577_10035 [Lewinellaceae bacterium]|nr:hypothetical protein [Saprospiraceae bacterium]MCB9338456.1 hypothetical protein [Lewinellaceae bacterium]